MPLQEPVFQTAYHQKMHYKRYLPCSSKINASYHLRYKLRLNFVKNKKEQKLKKDTVEPDFICLSTWLKIFIDIDAKSIAIALTKNNAQLIQNMSWVDLFSWLQNKPSLETDKINDIILSHKNAVDLYAYSIVSAQGDQDRRAVIAKIISVAQEMANLNNFFGLHEISSAFLKPDVKRLLEIANLDSLGSIQEKDQLNDTEPYLDRVDVYLSNLKKHYDDRPSQFDLHWYGKFQILLKEIHNTVGRSHYDFCTQELSFEIQRDIAEIPDGVIREYSHVNKPWPEQIVRRTPTTTIKDWTTQDLFSYLTLHGLDNYVAMLLDDGVWDGASLLLALRWYSELDEYQKLAQALKSEVLKLVEVDTPGSL